MLQLFELFFLGLIQFCVVRQGEVRIIEKRGQYARIATAGISILITFWGWGERVATFPISELARDPQGKPFLRLRPMVQTIPLRMQVDDYPKESVITGDKATVYIDAVVYYRIDDPVKAVYQVTDYVAALQKLVQAALRDECGKFELDELLVSRDRINQQLRATLDHATDPWGIKVDRVEIKDIDLGEFGRILSEQRAAETKRRTEITEAEGQKRSAVLRAEGERESAVLAAEGAKRAAILAAEADKESVLLSAEAQAQATIRMREAEAHGFAILKQVFDGGTSADQLLRILELQRAAEVGAKLAASDNKVFLPADINGMFGLVRTLTSGK